MRKKNITFPVRIGIVGVGAVSRLHLAAFKALPETVHLVAVCDTNVDAAKEFTKQLDGISDPETVTAHRDLLKMNLDAVIVTLPHHLHFPIARDFVAEGIPVLVEKPLTCTLDEAKELRELSHKYDTPVVAGQMRRFNKDATWLHRWVAADSSNFGDLRSFDIQSWQNIESYISSVGRDHWLLDGSKAGGGVVISLAIHQLDLLRFISGTDFAEVTARGRFDEPFHSGAESSASVLITMANGATGTLHATYQGPRVPYSEAMTLFGANGTIIQHTTEIGQYHGLFRFASTSNRSTKAWLDQYQDLKLVPEDEFAHLSSDPFVNQLNHFATALVNGEVPRNDIDENFNTIACIQAINDSLRKKKTVQVTATDDVARRN